MPIHDPNFWIALAMILGVYALLVFLMYWPGKWFLNYVTGVPTRRWVLVVLALFSGGLLFWVLGNLLMWYVGESL